MAREKVRKQTNGERESWRADKWRERKSDSKQMARESQIADKWRERKSESTHMVREKVEEQTNGEREI